MARSSTPGAHRSDLFIMLCLVDKRERIALALESFGGRMHGKAEQSNRNAEAPATSAKCPERYGLDDLNMQMQQLNKCVTAAARDIRPAMRRKRLEDDNPLWGNGGAEKDMAGNEMKAGMEAVFVLAVLVGAGCAQRPGEKFRDCNVCPQMVVLPAGSFLMGSLPSEEGRYENEGPMHEVTIEEAFAVGAYEVTFAEWDACAAEGGCGGYRPHDNGWGRGRRPVINVNWDDAQEYVRWLSGKTGRKYRLLSEAEWEYAARAGSWTRYSYGDDIGPGHNYKGSGHGKTVLVESYGPNGFGLYNMHGNVCEWVQDCGHWSYHGAPKDGRVWEGGDCSHRSARGGSWKHYWALLRSASRRWNDAGLRYDDTGFRVARTLTP